MIHSDETSFKNLSFDPEIMRLREGKNCGLDENVSRTLRWLNIVPSWCSYLGDDQEVWPCWQKYISEIYFESFNPRATSSLFSLLHACCSSSACCLLPHFPTNTDSNLRGNISPDKLISLVCLGHGAVSQQQKRINLSLIGRLHYKKRPERRKGLFGKNKGTTVGEKGMTY